MLSVLCSYHLGLPSYLPEHEHSLPTASICVSLLEDDLQASRMPLTVHGEPEVAVDLYPPSPQSAALANDWWMRSINAPASWLHDGFGSAIEMYFPYILPAIEPVILWRCLLDIAFLFILLPFLDLFFTSLPVFWEQFLINHIDTKSHLRICFCKSTLRDNSNFYPITLHQCIPFVLFQAFVKNCCYILNCLFTCLYLSFNCEQTEDMDCILLKLVYLQHLAHCLAIVVA